MVKYLDPGVVQLSILLKLAYLNLPPHHSYLSPYQVLSPVIDQQYLVIVQRFFLLLVDFQEQLLPLHSLRKQHE